MTRTSRYKIPLALLIGSLFTVPASAQLSNISISGSLETSFLGSTQTLTFSTPEPNGVYIDNIYPGGGEAFAYGMLEEDGGVGGTTRITGNAVENVGPDWITYPTYALYPSATADVSTSFVVGTSGIYSYGFYYGGSINLGGQITTYSTSYAPSNGVTWSGYVAAGTSVTLDTGNTANGINDNWNGGGGPGRDSLFYFQFQSAAVPEPSTLSLGIGMLGLCLVRRRSHRPS